jgi:hypothetical protein
LVAYSFRQQFIDPILRGAKRQTIRKPRAGKSRHAEPGQELQLYTGMRTKYCRLIGKATCIDVVAVTFDFALPLLLVGPDTFASLDELDEFACRDGFGDWLGMREFWAREHPNTPVFSGVLIRWGAFRASKR